MKTLRAMPLLQVSDVPASASFYARLGFGESGMWTGDDGTDDVHFGIIQRGDVTLGLQLLRGPLRVNTHWAAYIYVNDAAALHAEFASEGIETSELRQQPYGCADFDVRDPDGHLLAFGQDLDPGEPGPGLSKARGRG